MKIKINELKSLIAEGIRQVYEDYEVGENGELDLGNPVVIWNDTYDMDDHETMTRFANQTINLNPVKAGDEDNIDLALKNAIDPRVVQAEGKKDSYGNDFPWSIKKYAKITSKQKRKSK